MVSWDTRMLSVVEIPFLQPPRNLFRRPVQDQFIGNDRLQLPVDSKKTRPGPQSRLTGLMIGSTSPIQWTPSVTRHFPAHCRGSPLEPSGDLTNRRTGSKAS